MLSDPMTLVGRTPETDGSSRAYARKLTSSGSSSYYNEIDHASGRPSQVRELRVRQIPVQPGQDPRFAMTFSRSDMEDVDGAVPQIIYLVSATFTIPVTATNAVLAEIPNAIATLAGAMTAGNPLDLDRIKSGEH